MVRHKKDNFASRGNRNPNTRRLRGARTDEHGEPVQGPSFKAACWDLGHCDAKRCSGKRLMRMGMMRELNIGQKYPGVVVS